ncbi:MAG: GGDEF domain-containing protein [Clostridiales bacterium]|nr:GGDEF domain-containing protein [Clostridiales bacterium]
MSFNYNNLAEMCRERDKYKESLDYYNKALETLNKSPNKYSEIITYVNLSYVNMALEDYKKSLRCIEKAEEILNESKDIGEAIQCYYNYKAMFYYKMGYFQKAMSYAQKSVDMCISWGREADIEASYIILLCKSMLYKDLDYERLLKFAEKLFSNRKYRLGRQACHNFAEMFIEQNKLEEAKSFLKLSNKYSLDINTTHLDIVYEYLSSMACSGKERKDKLELLARLDKTIESKEIKWKLFKHLGEELFNEGKYYEALRQFITSLNVLRMLVENVPDEYKIKFLLSHNRHKVKECLIKTAQEITGKSTILGITLFGGEIKDVRKAITEYFDYKHFNDIIRKEDINLVMNNLGLNKSVMGSFVLEFLSKINNFSQNTEENIDSLIKMLAELTQAKNSFLAIADDDNDIVMLSEYIKNENRAFYKYAIEQVRQTGESMVITDVFEYRNNIEDNIIPNDIFAVFCIPVSWSRYNHDYIEDRRKQKEPNQINGYIYLDTDTIINNFTQETFKLCESVSKILQVLIENYRLKKISGIDKLTNLYTRKYFEMVLQNEIYINSTIQGTFSLIMMDIDKFKQINDRYGHQKGDEILQKVAAIVLDTVRKSDVCARYGGEEFLILLPRTDSEGAYNLAEKIRKNIEKARLLGYHNPITVSLGIATYPIHSSWMKDLIDKADQALYHSKENGRNRTTIFDINMIRTVKRVDKLAGIISGNMVDDQRNVETIIEMIELQKKHNISLDERLNEFLGKVIEVSEADFGYIFILDENKNVIEEIFRQNINKKNISTIEYNKHVLYKTINSMSGEYFIDWTGNAPVDPVTGMPNWQSKMVIPFVYADKIYAVLYLSSELKNREFDANIYNFTARLCEIITPIFCIKNE